MATTQHQGTSASLTPANDAGTKHDLALPLRDLEPSVPRKRHDWWADDLKSREVVLIGDGVSEMLATARFDDEPASLEATLQAGLEDDEVIIYRRESTTVQDSGTAESGTSTTLTDTDQTWTTDEHAGRTVHITGGTGAGQVREIASNTSDTLTVETAWDTTPDATSTYQILSPGGVTYPLKVVEVVGSDVVKLQRDPDRYGFGEWLARVRWRRVDGGSLDPLLGG